MNRRTLIATVLVCVSTIACSKQPDAPQVVVRDVAFDKCHFTMRDTYNGRLSAATDGGAPRIANYHGTINPKAHHPFDTWIQFSCEHSATAKTYLESASIKLTPRGWVLDTSKEDPAFPSPRTTFYALHGSGWEGAGTTQDDTDGDETRRTRAFNFCIPHEQLALCGSIQNVAYLMWPKETTLPQVIKLLESIEFIDTPVPASSSSSP
ncbi:hypothetical protein [Dyella sp. ASV21]|uniref:hypothetical protein n=1 Tax=Dyella sp. ASV21 TaxID=2795114 RepID=UPI0018EA4F70|nr:hypothetical protein [Dyella sp. ASV21]